MALWKRVLRSIRRLGIGIGSFVAAGVVAEVLPDNAAVGLLVFALIMVGLLGVIAGIGGMVRTLRLYLLLRAHDWTVYTCESLSIRETTPVIVVLTQGKSRFPVKFAKTKRAEILRGIVRPEMWFAGDPARAGILTVAGGGEMFRTKPMVVPTTTTGRNATRATRPAKRPVIKPLTPEQRRRQAAQAAAERVKREQRAKKLAAKQKANPPKPMKPAKPQPVRQPKLPRIRGGQKIKWQ